MAPIDKLDYLMAVDRVLRAADEARQIRDRVLEDVRAEHADQESPPIRRPKEAAPHAP